MRTRRAAAVIAAGAVVGLLAACSGGGSGDGGGDSGQELTILFGSSGDAETAALTEAAEAWASESGNTVEVVAASDLNQQLGQGFSGNNPPDLFYMG